jgi:predicted glycogen debranching enzyme
VTRAHRQTILAGYHWFGDWGRDTMIALPGLLLAMGQPERAKDILLQFTGFIDGGMLPNRFPDHGEIPLYNTVDATLWFFEAIRQYHHYLEDDQWRDQALLTIRESFYEPLQGIVAAHISGTRYGIHVDADGFLWSGDATTNLTWMDAKVGNVAITPRNGRAVEIQALWYNALRILQNFGVLFGDSARAAFCADWADKLKLNFDGVFWNDEVGYLNDVVRESEIDSSLRPNQMFTVSLHHNLLSGDRARKVLTVVENELLTPYGLRTLSSKDEHYRGQYSGDVWSRDGAYHQGTVWPWLIGPFFTAKFKTAESNSAVLSELESWLTGFIPHLREAGIGQVSEIFDGDFPHNPRGCIAQAWSVSEILRLAKMTHSIDEP